MNNVYGKPTGLRTVAAFLQNNNPNVIGVTIRTSNEFVTEFMDMLSSTIAVPKEITAQQAVYTLAHICLARKDIIAFEYSANKHSKRHPMHWYKLSNS